MPRKKISKIEYKPLEKIYVSIKEASEISGVSIKTIGDWINRRDIPSYSFGEPGCGPRSKHVRVKKAEFIEYIEKHRVEARSA